MPNLQNRITHQRAELISFYGLCHERGKLRPATAANVMLAAMAVIGVIDNVIPLLAEVVGLWQFYLMRTVLSIPLIYGLAAIGLGQVAPRKWGAVVLRSLLVAVSMMFYFAALALMPYAEALAGLFTSPIFIVLISVLFMGMRIGRVRILAVLLGFAGVLFVLQPDLSNFDWLILLPVAGGFFYALGAIATRSLCEGESTVSMLFGMLIAQLSHYYYTHTHTHTHTLCVCMCIGVATAVIVLSTSGSLAFSWS